jgi:hypothetical protein
MSERTPGQKASRYWKAGTHLMIIMKGLECSLLVSNEGKNTRPEGLQVLEDWHRHLTAFHVHPEIPVVLISHKN